MPKRCSYADGAIHFENNNFSVPYAGSVIPLKNSFKIAPGGNDPAHQGQKPAGRCGRLL